MMQERERRRANVSMISGKRRVEVVARTTIEPHSRAVPPGDDPKTVVLDLVQPLVAGRQFIGFSWEARRDDPAGRVRCNMQTEYSWLTTIATLPA